MLSCYMIPVIVISYNNYKYVENTVHQLRPFTDSIIILDNASTERETLDYLAQCGCEVRYNSTNNGPWVSPSCNKQIWDEMPDEFVLTDPDLEFNKNLPKDFIQRLSNISNKYQIGKVGFALKIDDFEDMWQFTWTDNRTLQELESPYWVHKIQDDEYELYSAPIDTTFTLVNKKFDIGRGIRVAGNFTARHLPWYRNNVFYTKEEIMAVNNPISSIGVLLRRGFGK